MVTAEFKATITNHNLLRARIMLKDSLLIDPTFEQFDEMLAYAKKHCPDIIVPFNGEYLEDDVTKWNVDVMNMELVQIVNNFSEVRIRHLKRIVAVVLSYKIQLLSEKKENLNLNNDEIRNKKKRNRMEAWRQITKLVIELNGVMNEVERTKEIKRCVINKIEKDAQQIITAIHIYRDNI